MTDAALAQSDAATDYEKAFTDICDQLGCAYDNEAALFAIDALQKSQSGAEQQLSAIAAAIGSSRFMDPPDGGNTSLAEQVSRMRKALERAEAALAQSNAGPQGVRALEAKCYAEGFADGKKAALAQADAEPVAWDKVRRVLEAARICFKSRDQDPVEMKVLAAIEIILAAPPRPDASAEPVAWRWRYKGPWPWTFIDDRFSVQRLSSHNEIEVEPLYTAPPRPDYELSAIAAAIGSSRFMDQPDGGDVSLAEQVCRMREALEKAEAALGNRSGKP